MYPYPYSQQVPWVAGPDGEAVGFDLPPWWTVIPGAAPFGMASWAGKNVGHGLSSLGITKPEPHGFDWSGVAKIGLAVGACVGVYFFYKGISGGIKTSAAAIRGGLEGAGGE